MTKQDLAFAAMLAGAGVFSAQGQSSSPMQIRTEFRFTVDLPYAEAFPLFGAWEEQKWAPQWKPRFIHPQPPVDQEGSVFVVEPEPSHSAIWVNTRFDRGNGRVQYVAILNRAIATRIDITITAHGNAQTDVSVVYERTAIDPSAIDHLKTLAKHDSEAGPKWQVAINGYAATRRRP